MLSELTLSFRSVVLWLALFLIVLWIIKYFNNRKFQQKKNINKTLCNNSSYLNSALFYWIILLLFFYKAVFFNKVLIPADILFQYYPWKAMFSGIIPHNPLLADVVDAIYPWMNSWKQAVSTGEVPLWNFRSYCGLPLAGNLVSASFHPFNLFLLVMPVEDVCTLLPFLRLFIAAMGTFVLLRSWNLPEMCCFLGGLIFAFCGVHIVWLSNYPEINVTMLLPWIFLCMDKVATGQYKPWVLLLSLFSALQLLGGHPETSFHLYVIAVPFFFWRLYGNLYKNINIKKTSMLKTSVLETNVLKIGLLRTGLMLLAGILALLLCAVQLIPFLEYLPLTSRYELIRESGENMFLSLDFVSVFQNITASLISPDFFGNPVDSNFWGYANYNEQTTHVTIMGLFLALLAVTRKGKYYSLKLFFIIAGTFSFLIAVQTPLLFEFVVSLPLFRHNSNHRLIFAFSFCLSLLAAFGMAELLEKTKGLKWRIFAISCIFILSAVFFHFQTSINLNTAQLNYRFMALILSGVFLTIAVLVATVPIFANGTNIKFFTSIKQKLPVIAVLFVILEIFIWGGNYNTFMDRKLVFPSTPLINFLKTKQDNFRVVAISNAMMRGTEQVYLFNSIVGMDPMKPANYEKILSRINGIYNPVDTPGIVSIDSPWIDFLNVGYIVTPPSEKIANKNLDLVYSGKDGNIYKNLNMLPRVFFAEKVLLVKSSPNQPDKKFELTVENENNLKTVVIDNPELKNGYLDLKNNDLLNCTIQNNTSMDTPPKIIGKTSNTITLQVNIKTCKILVLSEQYYPGWKVLIDGKDAVLLRANSSFMATMVSAGSKKIQFIYDPLSFKIGLIISGFAMVILLGFAIHSYIGAYQNKEHNRSRTRNVIFR